MQNPFQINPRLIQTVEQAKSALKSYDHEIETLVGNQKQAEESATATLAVLLQRHPDLKQDLDALAFGYRVMGTIEASLLDCQHLRAQFVMALPLAIRNQINQT